MIELNIEEFQDVRIMELVQELERSKCNFYYDETGNIGNLKMSKNGQEESLNENFILGGVMHFGNKSNADVENLKNIIKLQKSAKEIKCIHVTGKNQFIDCLNRENVRNFLNWVLESDLFVHYSNINCLYFTLIDIVDSGLIGEKNFDNGIKNIMSLKKSLYGVACKHCKEMYDILYRHKYPNVIEIKKFYNEIIKLVELEVNNRENNGIQNNIEIKFSNETELTENNMEINLTKIELNELIKFLRDTGDLEELCFLQDNEEDTILNDFSLFYLRPIYTYINSYHVFDRECRIKKELLGIKVVKGKEEILNYEFNDSKSQPLIQVADVFVGLMRKYFKFINSVSLVELSEVLNSLSDFQKNTLISFVDVLKKTDNAHPELFHSVDSIDVGNKTALIFEWRGSIKLKNYLNEFIMKKHEEKEVF